MRRRGSSGRALDPVRRIAIEVLERWQREHRHVEALVEQCERKAGPGTHDWVQRRRLREIVFSVVRLRGRYDFLLESLQSRRGKGPHPRVRAILWIALHEMLEMQTPAHAAVDQAVAAARALGHDHASGFVNALLREVERRPLEDFFGLPEDDPLLYACTWWSHPRWLVERWAEALGVAEMLALCEAQNRRPPLHLRSAPGRREDLRRALQEKGWQAEPLSALPDGLELVSRVPPAVVFESIDEVCVVQDGAAQAVAPLAAVEGGRILDPCAAPGGKAVHLAQLGGPGARVLAADLRADRLFRVRSTAARCGVGERLGLVVADGRMPPWRARFDAVLLDAPCTGTGVLARRHEARWSRRPADLVELPRLQRALLERALDWTRPGGTLVYATCSLEVEENDEVVDSLLAARDDVEEVGVDGCVDAALVEDGRLRVWPHRHGLDGAFAARLRRRETT